MVTRIHFKRLATALILAAGIIAHASAAEVDATLDRDSVPAGQGAILTINISGGRADQPVMPRVKDLIILSRGQSQKMQMFNGHTSISMIYNFAVGSNTPGDYQIPPIQVTIDGKQLSTQPLKLTVLDSAAAAPPLGLPQNQPGQPPAAEEEEPDTSGKRFGFLTVELAQNDRPYAYVGEIAPVRIRAWLPADSRAQLRSGIQPEGKAFTLHNVSSQPQQTTEIRDGKQYTVVTWFGGISATKAGKYPASLSVNATVAVRDTSAQRPRPRRQTGGPFDDPFFDSIFQMNAPMIQKDVTLKSDDELIEIRPLPADGRPDDFTGAVGDFKLDAWEAPTQWQTGEPQQIRARLSGSGNFTLLDAPGLLPADAWKQYPAKDEFAPRDNASFSGTKTFAFSAVPRKGGPQETSLSFSFFDPAIGAYKTLISPPKQIEVSGEDIIADAPIAEAPAPKDPDKKPNTELVAQKPSPGASGNLAPLVSRPAFPRLLATSVGLCLLGGILALARRRRENPQRIARAATEKAVRAARQLAEQHAATGNIPEFFAAARLTIQERLGSQWNQPAQAITLADVAARFPEESPVTRFFQEADRRLYNSSSSTDELPRWRALMDEALASLTPSAR